MIPLDDEQPQMDMIDDTKSLLKLASTKTHHQNGFGNGVVGEDERLKKPNNGDNLIVTNYQNDENENDEDEYDDDNADEHQNTNKLKSPSSPSNFLKVKNNDNEADDNDDDVDDEHNTTNTNDDDEKFDSNNSSLLVDEQKTVASFSFKLVNTQIDNSPQPTLSTSNKSVDQLTMPTNKVFVNGATKTLTKQHKHAAANQVSSATTDEHQCTNDGKKSVQRHNGTDQSSHVKTMKDLNKEERLRIVREKREQELEKRKKEIEENLKRKEELRDRQLKERQKRIDEYKMKENERRAAVEERRRQQEEITRARFNELIKKEQERDQQRDILRDQMRIQHIQHKLQSYKNNNNSAQNEASKTNDWPLADSDAMLMSDSGKLSMNKSHSAYNLNHKREPQHNTGLMSNSTYVADSSGKRANSSNGRTSTPTNKPTADIDSQSGKENGHLNIPKHLSTITERKTLASHLQQTINRLSVPKKKEVEDLSHHVANSSNGHNNVLRCLTPQSIGSDKNLNENGSHKKISSGSAFRKPVKAIHPADHLSTADNDSNKSAVMKKSSSRNIFSKDKESKQLLAKPASTPSPTSSSVKKKTASNSELHRKITSPKNDKARTTTPVSLKPTSSRMVKSTTTSSIKTSSQEINNQTPPNPASQPSSPITTSQLESTSDSSGLSHNNEALMPIEPAVTAVAVENKAEETSPEPPKIETELVCEDQVVDDAKEIEYEQNESSADNNNSVASGSPQHSLSSNNLSGAPSRSSTVITDEEEYKRKLEEIRREAREKAAKEAELERQRLEKLREEEEQREREEEERVRQAEAEEIRLNELARQQEKERLRLAIEENERIENERRMKEENERKAKEEAEKRLKEEAERVERERLEKIRKEEEERLERKKKIDLIMKRVKNDESINPSLSSNSLSSLKSSSNNDLSAGTVTATQVTSSNQSVMTTSMTTSMIADAANTSSSEQQSKLKTPLLQSILSKTKLNTILNKYADDPVLNTSTLSLIAQQNANNNNTTTTTTSTSTSSNSQTNISRSDLQTEPLADAKIDDEASTTSKQNSLSNELELTNGNSESKSSHSNELLMSQNHSSSNSNNDNEISVSSSDASNLQHSSKVSFDVKINDIEVTVESAGPTSPASQSSASSNSLANATGEEPVLVDVSVANESSLNSMPQITL